MKESRHIWICLLLYCIGCNDSRSVQRQVDPDDILLAEVGSRKLYYSDISDMISAKTAEDSLVQKDQFIEKWLRENVLITEAEKKLPQNIDLDKLVDDYRSSLMLHNFKQNIVESELDTSVTDEQLKSYYNEHKSDFQLNGPLIKGRVVVLSADTKGIDKFYRRWQRDDYDYVNQFLNDQATLDYDFTEEWKESSQILKVLPKKGFSDKDLRRKRSIQRNFEGEEYFIKIVDIIKKDENPPLSYIRDQVRKVVVHQRKKTLLESKEDQLYNQYLTGNQVKVHTVKQ